MEPSNAKSVTDAVEKYADLLFRIAYQILENNADAEDAVQNAFLRLLCASPFDEEAHRKAWLIRVTVNLCKDLRKSAWYRKRTELSESSSAPSQEQQDVLDEIWKLPARYRTVIYLYYYEEYTVSEISEILRRNKNTVASRLARARKMLKQILMDGGIPRDS